MMQTRWVIVYKSTGRIAENMLFSTREYARRYHKSRWVVTKSRSKGTKVVRMILTHDSR